MIGVGIIGCDGLRSSELVRILINHPDVELTWVVDVAYAGMRLDSIVPGIVGESDLVVLAEGSLDDIDLLYLCGQPDQVLPWLHANDLPEDLKVIDLSGSHNLDCGDGAKWTYGMSEMQRRVMVHDAQWVTVPGSVAVAALLALMPLARKQSLNTPLSLQLSVGSAVLRAAGMTADDGVPQAWIDEQQRELCHALVQCQPTFNQPVALTVAPHESCRLLTVEARFMCSIDLDMLRSLYEEYFDDHNFVFLVDRPVGVADVENTNKCLIRLSRDEGSGQVTVVAVMDGLIKAGVGNAVHAMNLMFGLYECIGLALKGSGC